MGTGEEVQCEQRVARASDPPLILVFLLSSSRDVGGLSSGAGRGLALEELRSESNHLRACPGYQHRTFCLPESPNPGTDNPDLWGSQVAGREHIYPPVH